MRRVSRKKQDSLSSREEAKVAPTAPGVPRRQQPSQEVFQQQRKKQQEEVANLTTKNYRLAKELADLRLKHRDECKHVTRLTMENMNLASRCREAISHVAMLKKELAMQQKRTAQALASQREQTKRMADSLTNSFISFSSPESIESNNRSNKKEIHRISIGTDEDENVMRLVSNTPSPDRDGLRHRLEKNSFDRNIDDKESSTKPPEQILGSERSGPTAANGVTKLSSPMEVSRDSPSTAVTKSPDSELDDDDTMIDNAVLASSTLRESPRREITAKKKGEKLQKQLPVVYSTPKKSERSKSSQLHVDSNKFDDTTAEKEGFFPFSASPNAFNQSKPTRDHSSYNEEFPSDTVDESESSNDGKHAKSKRKMNLMNSIDAFEQSFSTDFPDSFTPKESSSSGASPTSESRQKIYNPFFATPEKPKSLSDPIMYSTPKEEKKDCESSKVKQAEYKTPPKGLKDLSVVIATQNDTEEMQPKRPEKSIPPAARSRYDRVLGPRLESGTKGDNPIGKDAEKSSSSNVNSPTALSRRIQQKKRLDNNLLPASNVSTGESSSAEDTSSLEHKRQSRKSILNIVDTFEHTVNESADVGKQQKVSRFQGPIKSLRRRSVKKPISYAEPPLNTKLRRGDTFFPKVDPNMTHGDSGNGCDDQNKVPNVIQPAAMVSP